MAGAALLSPEAVVANLKATSKKQALQALARHAGKLTGLDERRIFSVLLGRWYSHSPCAPTRD